MKSVIEIDTLCSWIERLYIVKMSALSTRWIESTQSLSKFQHYSVDFCKLILAYVKKQKKQSNQQERIAVRRMTLPEFMTYYKAIIIKTVLY